MSEILFHKSVKLVVVQDSIEQYMLTCTWRVWLGSCSGMVAKLPCNFLL